MTATERINGVFVEKTGFALVITTTPAIEPFFPAREWLDPAPSLKRRFGDFRIGVSPRPFDSTHDSEAQPDETEPEVWWEEAANELSPGPPVWVARRRFGNVELTWQTKLRRLDARWRDLDRLVRLGLSEPA
jgi:hypothetical protein